MFILYYPLKLLLATVLLKAVSQANLQSCYFGCAHSQANHCASATHPSSSREASPKGMQIYNQHNKFTAELWLHS